LTFQVLNTSGTPDLFTVPCSPRRHFCGRPAAASPRTWPRSAIAHRLAANPWPLGITRSRAAREWLLALPGGGRRHHRRAETTGLTGAQNRTFAS